MTEDKAKIFATKVSLVIGAILMLVKFYGHALTGSQSILSDALESIVNVVAAGVSLWVMSFAVRPKDQDHPYGHGKAEYFSAAFEGGLIFFAAIFIIFDAIHSLYQGVSLTKLDVGIYIVLGAGFANLALGIFLYRQSQKFNSIALKASAHHVLSDFLTSVGIGVGLVVVLIWKIAWVDSALAIAMATLLLFNGYKLMKESIAGLLDSEDVDVLSELLKVFGQVHVEGIIQIHHVKVIRSGTYHHIDAHVVVPEFWNVKEVHDQMTLFEKGVIAKYPYGGEMNFHLDPCRKAYCRFCDVKNCPIRKEVFSERRPLALDDIRSPIEPVEFMAKRER